MRPFCNHDNDPETPECAECREYVGVMQDATLLLSGQFFYNRDEQCAMFVLDPDSDIAVVEIQDALGPGKPQLALVLNKNNLGPIKVVHETCLGDFDPQDEEEDDDEVDDDDYDEMKAAIARDHSEWDEHDLLRGR
jgi:hypothetical protein